MDVNALSRISQSAPAAATPVSADTAAQNRQVIQAVEALNQTEMFGGGDGLEFQRDPESKRWVVKSGQSEYRRRDFADSCGIRAAAGAESETKELTCAQDERRQPDKC
jgi:hypothetical protein